MNSEIVVGRSTQSNSDIFIDSPLNKYGWTALHAACYFGHMDLVAYLICDLHADVNLPNKNGWHSLIFAVYGGHLDVVDFLLYDTAVNQDQRDISHGRSAQEIAEYLGDNDLIEMFNEWETQNSAD